MSFWEFIGYVISASTIFWSFYIFIAKQIFNHFLNKDLEKFKYGLSLQIEKFKKELHTSAFEHETRFLKLHERRMDIIHEIYRFLVKTHKAFIELTRPMRLVGESTELNRMKVAAEAANGFKICFDENRIYLDEDICVKAEVSCPT